MSQMLKKLKHADTKRNNVVKAKSPHIKKKITKTSSVRKAPHDNRSHNETDASRISQVSGMTDMAMSEKVIHTVRAKGKDTAPAEMTYHDIESDLINTKKKRSNRLFLFITTFLVCFILMGSLLLLSKIGIIDNAYYASFATYKNNIQATTISAFAHAKDAVYRLVNMDEHVSAYQINHLLISDFNNRRYITDIIHAQNCIPSRVPRITEGEGDYVLNIFKPQEPIHNIRATVTLPVDNIILNQYSHIELWMKKKSPTGQPLTVSIFLESGLSTARYQLNVPNDTWKRYRIPLNDFGGVGYFSNISALSFVIHSAQEDKTWNLYIDDLLLTKESK